MHHVNAAGVGIIFKQDVDGVLVVDSISRGGPASKSEFCTGCALLCAHACMCVF